MSGLLLLAQHLSERLQVAAHYCCCLLLLLLLLCWAAEATVLSKQHKLQEVHDKHQKHSISMMPDCWQLSTNN
jgi:DMSO reductase anchor subunit